MHEPRVYRDAVTPKRRRYFRVRVKETDLFIHAPGELESAALDLTLACRLHIEEYLRRHPGVADSLIPVPADRLAPAVVREMIDAGRKAGVGPMAAVAGAVAESVGRGLLRATPDVIVENGGDIFIRTDEPLTVAVFAGNSPLSMKVGLKLEGSGTGIGVCTSSGTIGHSLSFGSADAVCVVSSSCALADASATAIGNLVRSAADLQSALAFGKGISGVEGVLIIRGDRLGAWGRLEIVPIGR